MKISVGEERELVLEEVYSSIVLKTSEGNEFAICMRDDTVEMKVVGFNRWYRADMSNGEIIAEDATFRPITDPDSGDPCEKSKTSPVDGA